MWCSSSLYHMNAMKKDSLTILVLFCTLKNVYELKRILNLCSFIGFYEQALDFRRLSRSSRSLSISG